MAKDSWLSGIHDMLERQGIEEEERNKLFNETFIPNKEIVMPEGETVGIWFNEDGSIAYSTKYSNGYNPRMLSRIPKEIANEIRSS